LGGAATGAARPGLASLRGARRLRALFLVVFVATFGGFFLTIVALRLTDAWLVGALLATVPLFVLPMSAAAFGERIGWRALLGTLAAVGGLAAACLRG
ncbi:MAG: EamA family transporter, partial [Elusimicrobia bacterium]|nr:EamA family transporter [Elusimicrobiota bacterium]